MSCYDWRERAACRSVHPEVFFPISHTKPGVRPIPADRETPRRICERCPVRLSCARLGLATVKRGWKHGVYAGIDLEARDARTRLLEVVDEPAVASMTGPETGRAHSHPDRQGARR
ncbi:WhiB family transcriptional regulator [Nocardia iowensis]|uniref:WhiB family transcriptional regulator n=1 Tax=Nocardia iowensis TaxID=204891 RepID=A0ABX8RSL3_NOCIO|nr:WhiB family transcriptional regulator [Nocardia iowensis]